MLIKMSIEFYYNPEQITEAGMFNYKEAPSGWNVIEESEWRVLLKENFENISTIEAKKATRIQALQDKIIIEGLTDREKKEYKELRGL